MERAILSSGIGERTSPRAATFGSTKTRQTPVVAPLSVAERMNISRTKGASRPNSLASVRKSLRPTPGAGEVAIVVERRKAVIRVTAAEILVRIWAAAVGV